MTFRSEWSGVDGLAAGLEKDFETAVTGAMGQSTQAMLEDVRSETAFALRGNKMAKTWRARTYPTGGVSAEATGWVYTRAAKLIQVFSTGAVIYARNRRFVAFPTEEAGRYGLKLGSTRTGHRPGDRERNNPKAFERLTGLKLRFVPRKDGGAVLIADKAMLSRGRIREYRSRGRGSRLYGPSGQSFVAFILEPHVRIEKRLDLDAIADRGAARFPVFLERSWR